MEGIQKKQNLHLLEDISSRTSKILILKDNHWIEDISSAISE